MSATWAQGGFSGPGRYEISSVQSRLVLDLDRNDQRTIIQFDSRRTDNQVWQVEEADRGFFFIRNGMNGFALEAIGDRNGTPVEGNRFHGGPSQQWRIVPTRGRNAQILNANGRSLDVPDGTRRAGSRINIFDANNDPNQEFIFRRLDGAVRRWDGDRRDGDRRDMDRRIPAPPPVIVEAPRGDGIKYFDERERMWKMRGSGACFYPEAGFNGNPMCVATGDERNMIGREYKSFASVKLFGRAREVHVFERERFGGRRMELRNDAPDLGRAGIRGVFSIRVF